MSVWEGQSITGDDDPFSSPTSGPYEPIDTPDTYQPPEPDTSDDTEFLGRWNPLRVLDPDKEFGLDLVGDQDDQDAIWKVPWDGTDRQRDSPGDGFAPGEDPPGSNPLGNVPSVEKIVIGLVAVLALLVGVNAFASGTAEGLTS